MNIPKTFSSRFLASLGAAALLALLQNVSGCAGAAIGNGHLPDAHVDGDTTTGSDDARAPDLQLPCTGPGCPCATSSDCHGGQKCGPQMLCVDCVGDGDCAAGTLCNPVTHICNAGCSTTHGCGDAGVCELDGGLCVGCLSDTSCGDAANPRCDTKHQLCVACLPSTGDGGASSGTGGNDGCAPGLYCGTAAGTYACVPGCKTDGDCASPGSDGGASGNDGGSANNGAPHCDTAAHQCVACLSDDQCSDGKRCSSGACVDGCTAAHGCPNGQSCCAGLCATVDSDATNCGACGMACQGGWNCCGGVCSNPGNDVGNCGGCGAACAVANAAPRCALRSCVIDTCAPGYADCNASPADGCEIHTDDSVVNCGQCNTLCTVPHAQPKCAQGACQIDYCMFPYADCDTDPTNGCETFVGGSDLANCGACNTVCAPMNAVAACAQGACKIGSCNAGYADCNTDPSDGCETRILDNPLACGACGLACSTINETPTCALGKCVTTCLAGYADCNGSPADGCETAVSQSAVSCGGCGLSCSANHIGTPLCDAGACTGLCDLGYDDCDGNRQSNGCETDTAGDVSNCGGCGVVCMGQNIANRVCIGGTCGGSCDVGFADCDADKQSNGCETPVQNDVTNCGGCKVTCSANHITTPTCQLGACTGACDPGYADCDGNRQSTGCEAALLTDPMSCGTCGVACSTNHVAAVSCGGGVCNGDCAVGWADCDGDKQTNGCETNVDSDPAHCGGCGAAAACSSNHVVAPVCTGGVCTSACSAGYIDCDGNKQSNGCESPLVMDPNNCGGCNIQCSGNNIGTPTCAAGDCNGTCNAGTADCNKDERTDGCEVTLATDPLNCGGCGSACSNVQIATPTCVAGACSGACNTGYGDCNNNKLVDGCETNTLNDVNNCGPGGLGAGCAQACSKSHISALCSFGSCESGACLSGYADCNASKRSDGCETYTDGDASNCGGCNQACSPSHITPSCSAGQCNGVCAAGYSDCNSNKAIDGCEVYTFGDPDHCGACAGAVCSSNHLATRTCTAATCDGMCATGYLDCNGDKMTDGCEVNVNADPAHCGACNGACSTSNITATCTAGSCESGVCAAGWADCNVDKRTDGCEKFVGGTDLNNCGGCGLSCSSANMLTITCGGGACNGACATNYGDCNSNKQTDGCETNLQTSATSCGACGTACSTSHMSTVTCAVGKCSGACAPLYGDCNSNKLTDGCETSLIVQGNCGGCGLTCSSNNIASPTCSAAGACNGACNTNYADCDANKQTNGCEVNLQTDVNNCGTCGHACGLGFICQTGSCKACVVVNEVSVEDWYDTSDEWVELLNVCSVPVNLASFTLVYRGYNQTTGGTVLDNNIGAAGYWTGAPNLAAGQYILYENYNASHYVTPTPNIFFNVGSLYDVLTDLNGGGVAILNPSGAIVDAVGFGGSVNNGFIEGAPTVMPDIDGKPPGNSIGRHPNGADTNQNSVDFKAYTSAPDTTGLGTPGKANN